MGLFIALLIIGIFLVAGIGYSTWRQQQIQSDISRARKLGAQRGTQRKKNKKMGDFFQGAKRGARSLSIPNKSDNPDNLEKALDAIKLKGVSDLDSDEADRHVSSRSYRASQYDDFSRQNSRSQTDVYEDDYDDLPSDDQLANAQANSRAERPKPADEVGYQRPSQLPLDEYGEPLTVDYQKQDASAVKTNQNHEPTIARDDVEWLNISMSYNGLVSHISAYIGGKSAFSVEQVMAQIKEMESQVGTRIKMHYRSTPGTSWRRLERVAGVDILELMLSLQLADREGPVTEAQLTRFASSVVDIAESINRTLHWSLDIDSAADQANTLFNTGKKFDLVAIIHLVANDEAGFSGGDLREAATEARMQLNDRGAFEYFDRAVDPVRPLFTMTNRFKPGLFNWSTIENERIKGLKLFMYLPHIADPKWAYDEMVRVGHSIERRLDATLIDQQGNVLNKALSSEASDGIEQYAVLMKNYGMKPGGEVAMSLIGDA